LGGVASVEGLSGDYASARRDLQALLKLNQQHFLADSSIVFAYAGLGDNDSALYWLSRAVDERSISFIEMNNDALFDGFRDDPRFLDIRRRMKLAP